MLGLLHSKVMSIFRVDMLFHSYVIKSILWDQITAKYISVMDKKITSMKPKLKNTSNISLHKIYKLKQIHVFLDYISFFVLNFLHIFYFLYAHVLSSCFHFLCFFQMLQLEFHVIQGGFKHHYWSTSSRVTAPLANQMKRGGDITPMHLITADVQLSVQFYR